MATCKDCGDILRMFKVNEKKLVDPKDSGWRRVHSTAAKSAGCKELAASRRQHYYPETQGSWAIAKDGVLEWRGK